MKKHFPSTPFGTLALIALALMLFANAASAAPPAPVNHWVYDCPNPPSDDWGTLKFDLRRWGTYRTGYVYKNNDNRKAALALKGGVWEFTFVNDVQCKELVVKDRRSELSFKQCSDGIERTCYH